MSIGKMFSKILNRFVSGESDRSLLKKQESAVQNARDGVALPDGGMICAGRDLAGQREADERLKTSEEQFRAIFENAAVGIVILDAGAHVIKANGTIARILGYSPGELRGIAKEAVTHPDDLPGDMELFGKLLAGAIPDYHLEKRYISKDGALVWGAVFSSLVKPAKDAPPFVVSMVVDITEIKKARDERWAYERTLRETKEKYEKLLYMSPDSIVLTDLNFNILLANKKTAEFVGVSSPGKMPGTSALKYVQAAEVPKIMAYGKTVLEKGELGGIALDMKKENGALSPVEMNVSLFMDAADKPAGFIVVTRDVSERREAEARLRESEVQFRLLVENAPYGIYVQVDGRFDYLNASALSLFGAKSAEELLGQRMMTRFHPAFHEIIRKRVDALSQKKSEVPMLEEKYLRMDGSEFDVLVSAVPFIKNGHDGAIVFFRDITEKKRQESEMLNTQKIESLGVMAGGIAHDFNNMLMGITGNLSLLGKKYSLDLEGREMLSEALSAAVSAQDLTRQLLTFAKGGRPLKKILDLRRLLTDAANFAVRGTSSRCEFAVAEDLACVDADEGQLKQVIHNITLNAVQAMPGGGVVRIEAANCALEAGSGVPLPAGPYIELTFSDTGVGVSERHLSRIFEPYFSTKTKGHGLGLSTSYSIVKNHGGDISAASAAGAGATFTVFLPAAPGRPCEAAGRPDGEHEGSGRVLIMDDDETVGKAACRMLASMGYGYLCVKDGAEAVKEYEKAFRAGKPFVAVISDLTVPGGVGGKETALAIRKMDPHARLIVSSGYSDDAVLADYAQNGFDAVLAKPYGIGALAAALSALLKGN